MSTQSPLASMALCLLLSLMLLLSLFEGQSSNYGAVCAAPLSIRKTSANTQFFKNLIYSGVGFNRTMMYHKDEVTSELVELLRNNPEAVLSPRNNTIDHF